MRSRRRTASRGSARPDRRPAARRAHAGRSSAPRGTRGAAVRLDGWTAASQRSAASVVASASPLDVRRAARVVAAGQVVVVGVEPAIEPEAPIEREPRDERRRAVAGLPEVLGGRAHRRREHVAAVVPEPVAERRAAGEDRRVRRTGQRRMRDRGLRSARPAWPGRRGSASSPPASVAAEWSARSVSIVTSRTLGRSAGAADGAPSRRHAAAAANSGSAMVSRGSRAWFRERSGEPATRSS